MREVLLNLSGIPSSAKKHYDNTSFPWILEKLPIKKNPRILDLGAGGFCGESTLKYYFDLLGDGSIDAIELEPERALRLREKFGSRVNVIESDAFSYAYDGEYDLIVIDLDSGLIPEVMNSLLKKLEPFISQNCFLIVLCINDLKACFKLDKPLVDLKTRDLHANFMLEAYGGEVISNVNDFLYSRKVSLRNVGVVDKFLGIPGCGVGWLILQR